MIWYDRQKYILFQNNLVVVTIISSSIQFLYGQFFFFIEIALIVYVHILLDCPYKLWTNDIQYYATWFWQGWNYPIEFSLSACSNLFWQVTYTWKLSTYFSIFFFLYIYNQSNISEMHIQPSLHSVFVFLIWQLFSLKCSVTLSR